jgi:hypothetical protein
MSKSGKSANFRHVFANYFFVHFLNSFSTDLKSAWNSAFLIHFFNLKKILGHIVTFEAKRAKNGRKKQKTFFYEHVLEFSATINGLV